MERTPLGYQALGGSAEGHPRPLGRSLGRCVALACPPLAALLLLVTLGRREALLPTRRALLRTAVSLRAGPPGASAVNLAEGYRRDCWMWTGGECNAQDCKPFRNATCTQIGIAKLCTCPAGCAGADYACHAESNERVARSFALENAYYPGNYLYVPTFRGYSQLGVSELLDDTGKFSLWRVPGVLDGAKRFMLGPVVYQNDVVEVVASWQPFGSAFKLVDVDPSSWTTWFSGGTADPANSFLSVCRVNGHLRFGTCSTGDCKWAYSHFGTWYVYAWNAILWGDPDERAEWIVDSSVLDALDDCQ